MVTILSTSQETEIKSCKNNRLLMSHFHSLFASRFCHFPVPPATGNTRPCHCLFFVSLPLTTSSISFLAPSSTRHPPQKQLKIHEPESVCINACQCVCVYLCMCPVHQTRSAAFMLHFKSTKFYWTVSAGSTLEIC